MNLEHCFVLSTCSTVDLSYPHPAAGPPFGPSNQPAASDNQKTGLHSRSLAQDDWPTVAPVPSISLSNSPSSGVQPAPVANQSADARAAIIATISLYGGSLIPFGQAQRQSLTTALGATVVNSTNTSLTSIELLSVCEYLPTNTTSSSSPSRRLLVMRTLSGKLLHLSIPFFCDTVKHGCNCLNPKP